MSTAQQVIHDLESFVRNVGHGVDDLGYEMKTSVVREIVRAGAIDTTAMIQSVDYHRSPVTDSGHRFEVDTSNNPDVFYDGFVEFDTRNRDGSVRRGRRFYEKGIEHWDIERIFNQIADRSFVV